MNPDDLMTVVRGAGWPAIIGLILVIFGGAWMAKRKRRDDEKQQREEKRAQALAEFDEAWGQNDHGRLNRLLGMASKRRRNRRR